MSAVSAVRKKLKDIGGLTMVEMLCAVIILVLLVLMMNTGMHMAVRNYYSLTSESETELLLSSLTDALADKLRYAVLMRETETVDAGGTSMQKVTYNLFMGGEKIQLPNENNKIEEPTGANLDVLVELKDGMVVIKDVVVVGDKTDKKLLPDAAYGNYNKVSHDQSESGSDPIKYTVGKIEGSKPIVICKLSGDNIMFEINLKIEDESTGITKEAKGLSVRCLNPLRKVEVP